jgi:PKD repeat protein
MKQILLITFAFLTTFIAFAQPKTLVFYQASQADKAKVLWKNAEKSKHLIDTTSNPARLNEENLKKYNAIVFLNTSINALNFRESAEVQRFMQAGGGFVGIHSAIEKSYQWLWYKKMIGGTLAENQLEDKAQLSIITNAYLGKTQLPPLWKIEDKPLIMNTLPVSCKPVLLDVMGKTWAWYYTTEEGGKMFYTALGGELTSYQNQTFIDHLWAGIEEVSSKKLPDYSKIADSALPSDANFLKVALSENLENPIALATTPDRNIILIEQNGKVKIYNTQKRKTNLAGNIDASNLKSIKLDPEFTQNGYVYTFTEIAPNEYKIGRLQMMGDSVAVLSDFSSQSSTPISKSITYNFENYTNEPYRLPKYFDGKTFKYDNEKGFILETFDEDGNLKNREPFLQNSKFYYIQGMAFGADGALYFLENNQLMRIDYSEKNRVPIAIASADILVGNAPLKVKFLSAGSIDYDAKDVLSFEWNFGGTNISHEPNPTFTFTKIGNYNVKLQVFDNQGNTSESTLSIQVNKANTKRR